MRNGLKRQKDHAAGKEQHVRRLAIFSIDHIVAKPDGWMAGARVFLNREKRKETMTPMLWLLSLGLIIVGMAGTVLPAMPGTPLIYAGLLLAAWGDGFAYVSGWTMAFLGLLTVLAFAIDLISGSIGAKKTGASREAVIGAAVGAVVGLFFGFVGVFVGPFIGAVIGEFLVRRDLGQAGVVGLGTWIGLVVGIAAKLMLAFSMVGIFVLAYIF
jgi:uncharacterized protein